MRSHLRAEAWARGDLLFLSDLEAGLGDEIYHGLFRSVWKKVVFPLAQGYPIAKDIVSHISHISHSHASMMKTRLLESDRKQCLNISIVAAKDARRHALFLHWLGWPSMPRVVGGRVVWSWVTRGIEGPWKHENRKRWQTSRSAVKSSPFFGNGGFSDKMLQIP